MQRLLVVLQPWILSGRWGCCNEALAYGFVTVDIVDRRERYNASLVRASHGDATLDLAGGEDGGMQRLLNFSISSALQGGGRGSRRCCKAGCVVTVFQGRNWIHKQKRRCCVSPSRRVLRERVGDDQLS